jgi:predicted GIY-YIG superfamily endonuclease
LSLMHYAYIIESLTTGKWYYGSSGDLAERLNHHHVLPR